MRLGIILITLLCIGQFSQGQMRTYDQIHEREQKIIFSLMNKDISLKQRISSSKKAFKEMLKTSYSVLDTIDKSSFRYLTDIIIKTEMKLGRYRRAERMARTRITKLCPSWNNNPTDIKGCEYINTLGYIEYWKGEEGFYSTVRRYNGLLVGCDDHGIIEDIERGIAYNIDILKCIKRKYGIDYCLGLLKSWRITINPAKEVDREVQREMAQLVLDILECKYDLNTIRDEYLSQEIEERPVFLRHPIAGRAEIAHSDFMGIELIYEGSCDFVKKQVECEEVQYLNELKVESELYREIIERIDAL